MLASIVALVMATPLSVLNVHTLIPTAEAAQLTKSDLVAIATSTAERYGLTKKQTKIFLDVVSCESGWDVEATGKLGERGLVQIYPKYHPAITKEEMLDPYFSLDFLAKNLFKHPSWWTCFSLVS